MRCARAWLLPACLAADMAHAALPPAPPAAIHVEETRHYGTDRVAIWLTPKQGLTIRQDGDQLVLGLPAGAQISPPAKPQAGFGTYVHGIDIAGSQVRIALAPGSHPRVRWLWNRVWIDVDASLPKLVQGQFVPEQVPPTVPAAPSPPVRAVKAVPLPAPATARQPDAPAAPAAPATPAAAVTLLSDGQSAGGPAIAIPVERAGAAAFSRGGELHLVFDSAVPLDIGPLKDDPAFGSAREHLLPDGAELILRPPAGARPQLSRRDGQWVLSLGAGTPATTAAITGRTAHGTLTLAAAAPGHVVVVEDEATGGRILVGTQHEAGQRMPVGHDSPEFCLLPSWQGVVIQPRSDRVAMRDTDAGFIVAAAEPPALAAIWPDGMAALRADGSAMTRRFDLPGLPVPVLRRRLAETLRDAAQAPRTGRTAPRVRVAQAMLSVGLDQEAAAVLQAVQSDDPAAAADPTVKGLGGIAAWLSAAAGGSAAPAPLQDTARLGDSDEAVLWRALWSASADPAGEAALLAPRWQLLLAYPAALRSAMLPAIADLLAKGGQEAALTQLLATFPTGTLDLARAAQLAHLGKAGDALKIFDRLAAGRDRLVAARAQEAAIEARLADHTIGPAAAAAQLEGGVYAWRGGGRELRVRLRAAQLRAQSGAWRPALGLLRDTDPLFPEAHEAIHAAQVAVVSGVLQGGRAAQLGALDLIAFADEASQLLGPGDTDATLAPLLADRLAALDLPARAEPILCRLMDNAPPGAPRATIGLRLAGLLAEDGDRPAALAALESSGAGPLDAGLAESRTLLRARLLAESGRAEEALAQLAGLASPAALDLRASIAEDRKDWLSAERSLQIMADSAAFSTMAPDAQRAAVLRAARDAEQAGDMAGLHAWRVRFTSLFAGAADAGLFAVLTAEPVRHASDLPRAGKELGAIRALPAALAVASARP